MVLNTAQGPQCTTTFFWDRYEGSRAFCEESLCRYRQDADDGNEGTMTDRLSPTPKPVARKPVGKRSKLYLLHHGVAIRKTGCLYHS